MQKKTVKKNSSDTYEWTPEALQRVDHAPDFVRPGIYKLMQQRAKERGKEIIDSDFLSEIRNESMMMASKRIKMMGFEELTTDAFDKAKEKMRDSSKQEVIDDIKNFLGERTKKKDSIIEKFQSYLKDDAKRFGWEEGAKKRLENAPAFVQPMAKMAIENEAKKKGYKMVTEAFVNEVMDGIMPKNIRENLMRK